MVPHCFYLLCPFPLRVWCRAYSSLDAVGVFDAKSKDNDPHKLLNRLLAVEVEMQGRIFQYFTAFMDHVSRGWPRGRGGRAGSGGHDLGGRGQDPSWTGTV